MSAASASMCPGPPIAMSPYSHLSLFWRTAAQARGRIYDYVDADGPWPSPLTTKGAGSVFIQVANFLRFETRWRAAG
jgi:hypothetical protein